jgi:hypothetical protein
VIDKDFLFFISDYSSSPYFIFDKMSSDDSLEAAQKAVLAEVTKPDHGLKHVEPPPAESLSTTQAKVLLEVQGQHELHHVEPPPAELLSTTQAKVLIEVQGGQHELHHVDNPPKEGLTEAEKQAYLEEKQQPQE